MKTVEQTTYLDADMGVKYTAVLEDFGFAVHVLRKTIDARVSLSTFPTIQ